MPGVYSSVVLEGLGFVDGDENTSGIQETAYIIPRSYFDTIATTTPSTTTASQIEIPGDHILNAGKAPIEVFTLFEKSGMDAPLAGELFSKLFMPTAKFFMPQPDGQNAANFSVLKNGRFIILIKRTQGGDYLQIGTEALYAKVKDGSLKLGDGPTGAPGIEFQIEAPSIHPYYIYKGAFPAPAG